jgi:hypothetical protein
VEDVRTFGKPPAPPSLGLGRRLAAVRTRSRALVETLNAQSQARRALTAIRLELERLQGERDTRLRELGAAVYADDAAGTETARAAIRALDDGIAAKEEQMNQIAEQVQERVGRAQAEARSTESLEPPATEALEPQPAPEPPAPAPIPEPYPPPDEGTPPTPAPVPEPYPPPDEGDLPQP